ncbi:ABC transporter permease [Luteibacter sp.]|uniref:ABC transporter permease n=1 Tax=Luteibacter sp. TaxID=1886636 RepID=UPI003F7F0A36
MSLHAVALRRLWHALLRRPGHFLLGSATLGLAVGMFFATFALVDALLLRPPAFDHHRSVVLYGEVVRPGAPRSMAASLYDAIGLPAGALSRGLARSVEWASVRGEGHAGLLMIQRVDPGFLHTLGVVPALGGIALEHGGADGLLISWRLWQAWFGGDATIVGRHVAVDGRELAIAGVLPETYRLFDDVDVLLPLRAVPGAGATVSNYIAVARLAPGENPDAFATRARAASPEARAREGFGATPIGDALTQASGSTLWFFLGCAVLVLATACGNLANLILARALGRGQETALRRALGAGFWGAWTTAAIEAAVIGVVGLAVGVMLGHALVRAGEGDIPDAWRINAGPLVIGWHVYVASGVVAFAVVTLAVIGGTLHEHGDALMHEYIGGYRQPSERVTAGGIRVAMVQFQLALATVLLSLCVVRGMQAWRAQEVAPGFEPAHAIAARFRPDTAHINVASTMVGTMRAIDARASALPGVVSAGVTTQLPASTSFNVAFAGPGGIPVETQFALHTPGARAALGLRLLAGRDLNSDDTSVAPGVVVVNRAFLASIPDAKLGGTVLKVSRSLGDRPLRIVGVVADTRDAGPARAPRPLAIIPFAQLPASEFQNLRNLLSYYLVVRGPDDAGASGADLTEAMHVMNPWLTLEPPRPLARAWRESGADIARDTWLAAWFACVGLGLGLVGLYSAQRVEVASRQRDLGLCAALGASPGVLLGMCLARGIARGSFGIALGLGAAFALSRWPPPGLAPGVRLDPAAALIAAIAMLLLTAAVALLPAWRSAGTPAWVVLRSP